MSSIRTPRPRSCSAPEPARRAPVVPGLHVAAVGHFVPASTYARRMTDELVLTDVRADGVATLRLNRPPMNALSQALLGEIADAAEAFAGDDAVKAVVVLGGEKAFAAGADITEFGDQAAAKRIGTRVPGRVRRDRRDPAAGDRGGERLRARRRPGAGDELRPADRGGEGAGRPARDPARHHPRGRRHATPAPARRSGAGQGAGLERAPGAGRRGAGDRVSSTGSCRADELEEQALAWAAELASGAVVAMGLAKQAIDEGLDGSLARGLDVEAEAFVEVFGTEDAHSAWPASSSTAPGRRSSPAADPPSSVLASRAHL